MKKISFEDFWKNRQKGPASEWFAAKAFAAAIGIGALLLCTPLATQSGKWPDPLTAIFTATSATCVTGLVVVDTGTFFSEFGQTVIILLIQLGGIGFMTLGTFFLVLSGRRLAVSDESVLMDAMGTGGVNSLKGVLKTTILFTLSLETIGALLIAHRLMSAYGFGTYRALCDGFFHAISAFCNAGFALHETSLTAYRADPVIVPVILTLIVLGGLGFVVVFNLGQIQWWRRDRLKKGRLTLHSRIVLATSAVLTLAGAVSFYVMERNNVLYALPLGEQISCSIFQGVTPRTAGFNVVDMSSVLPATLFSTMVLMFIGGSPASTAGGIKTTTLVVLMYSVIAIVRGRDETEIRHRIVPGKIVRESLSIFFLAIFLVSVFSCILLVTERHLLQPGMHNPEHILFEAVSAFATVGLSAGVTPHLSAAGRIAIIMLMFIGRLGPLTLALTIGRREVRPSTARYPEEEIVVG